MISELKLKSIAEDYFASKSCKTQYEVLFNDPEVGIDCYRWVNFLDDEVERMKAIKEGKGNQYLLNHLDEVIEDEDVRNDLLPEGVYAIDLDNPINVFAIKKHYFINNNDVISCDKEIKIHPEDYIKLLTLFLYDKNMNFNKLRHAESEVFKRILLEVDELERDNDTFYYHCEYPYCITFPEIEEDVKNILAKHPEIKPSTGCGYSFSY